MRRIVGLSLSSLLAGCGVYPLCVARGTRVRTKAGEKNVEDLRVGDMVIAVDPATGNQAVSPITAITTAQRECGTMWFAGRSLAVTSDHPLYDPVSKGFFPAGDWLLGERKSLLLVSAGTTSVITIDRVERFSKIDHVFDLTVEHEWHTFIAEGVVVHNKSPARLACPDPSRDGGTNSDGLVCSCGPGYNGRWRCDGSSTANGRCTECEAAPDGGTRDGG